MNSVNETLAFEVDDSVPKVNDESAKNRLSGSPDDLMVIVRSVERSLKSITITSDMVGLEAGSD